jgi:uncharacterized protein YndB with AHSA1/START domain
MEFTLSTTLPATPNQVYRAWLDSAAHAAMIGGSARVSDEIGESFEAWDGYITGNNLELEPGVRILQTWRTTEFADDEEDSLLEILFADADDDCRITLHHSNLPAHGAQYEQGWIDNYFEPMTLYLGEKNK